MAQAPSSGGTSSRSRHNIKDEVPINPRLTHYPDPDWETKEALRQRVLEETKARAAQMEKTMRWWSDCTANWREKWSKVRNERNKAREEAKLLRTKLEIAVKDGSSYKHELKELEIQNEQLKKEIEKLHMVLLKHAGQFDRQIVNILESDPQLRNSLGVDDLLELYNNVDRCERTTNYTSTNSPGISPKDDNTSSIQTSKYEQIDRDIEEYVLQGAVPKHAVELYKEGSMGSLERDIAKLIKENSKNSQDMNDCKHQLSRLNFDDETVKLIAEKGQLDVDKSTPMEHNIEKLQMEVIQLQSRCNQLEDSKAEALRELAELKDQYQIEILAAKADLIDETANRESMDQRLNELRSELEKLQIENSVEWRMREQLETEKIALERENKKLTNELKERLESRRSRPISGMDTDIRQFQQDLIDMKHINVKLKKALNEKTTELTHALRRSDQYEAEVKRVRCRVDELKKELANAQDEVDAATTSIRRLQRTNEDLMDQLEHLKSTPEPRLSNLVEISDDFSRNDDDNDDSLVDFNIQPV